MIGLELVDNGAVAVDVDDDGRVLGRGEATATGDPAAAAVAALASLGHAETRDLAVASLDPDSPESAAAMKALQTRFPGLLDRPAASGNAAAAAEAWIGAARGARDVAFFGVDDHAMAGIL